MPRPGFVEPKVEVGVEVEVWVGVGDAEDDSIRNVQNGRAVGLNATPDIIVDKGEYRANDRAPMEDVPPAGSRL